MPGPIYVITGTNRGLGLALVKAIADKEKEAVVYAGVRDPNKAAELNALAANYSGRVVVTKIVSGDVEGTKALASEIKTKYGHVDVVIANAAISNYLGTCAETPAKVASEHYDVNFIGPLILFQEMYELLKASSNPRFIPIATGGASLATYISLPAGNVAYGASKVALNFLARKIHFENDWLVSFPLAPGVVVTDMFDSNSQMDKTGSLGQLKEISTTAEDAAARLADIVINATREKHGGEFINVDGSKIPW